VDIEEKLSKKGELKRCKVLDANGNKCRTYYVNDGSTENAINLLLNNYEITNDSKKNQNQTTLSTIVKIQKHKESQQYVLYQFLTDWIINDL
ncbi:6441_t:CDS:2, partial [Funneliformis geosporum]